MKLTTACRGIEIELLNCEKPIEKCVACQGTVAGADVVWNCIPVPAFGNPTDSRIKVATIGLNPALNEPRLPTLANYHKNTRDELSASDVKDVQNQQRNYFNDPHSNWHVFFEAWDSVLGRMNHFWSFGNCVVHIDLVACVTKERFGKISEVSQKTLITNCRRYFLKTLLELPETTLLLLDGKRVCDGVLGIALKSFDSGPERILINPKMSGLHGSIAIGEKSFRFCGWNLPVSKLTPLQRMDLANWARERCS